MIETESRFKDAMATGCLPVHAPAMTRCECSGITFEQAAHLIREHGLRVTELIERTGCGGTCTACLPDLERYLAATASSSS